MGRKEGGWERGEGRMMGRKWERGAGRRMGRTGGGSEREREGNRRIERR